MKTESGANGPSRIFISYRRDETAYAAGWLYDRLSAEFGEAQIFKDVDDLRPGDDFVDTIIGAVSSCDVLLAIIGPEWLSVTGDHGARRLDDPTDWVRLEVGTALARGVRVIPVLLADAKMPARTDLPSNLVPLVRRHAFRLSPAQFNSNAEELVRHLKQALKQDASKRDQSAWSVPVPARAHPGSVAPAPDGGIGGQESTVINPRRARLDEDTTPEARPTGLSRLGRARWLILGSVALLLLAVIGWQLSRWISESQNPPLAGRGLPQSVQPLPDDVFVIRQERDGVRQIETIDLAGQNVRTLISGKGSTNPMLTRDRRTVLYLQDAPDGRQTLHAISADGQGDQSLFTDGSDACPSLNRPAIGADGLLVVACMVAPGDLRLNVMKLDGTWLRTLDEGTLGGPSVTRDGKSVVYWKAGQGDVDPKGGALLTIPVAGTSEPTAITDPTSGLYGDTACSPTADVVVARRLAADGTGLGLVSIDLTKDSGAAPETLTTGQYDLGPSWSPDGSQMLFRQELNPGFKVSRLSPDRGDLTTILDNPDYMASPVWTAR